MKNKMGYTLIELMILMGILAVATIATVLSVSYAFDDGTKEAYEDAIANIEEKAMKYAEDNVELIKTENLTITVDSLIDKNYLTAELDGDITDPRNEKGNLNNLKIKISYDEKTSKPKVEVVE